MKKRGSINCPDIHQFVAAADEERSKFHSVEIGWRLHASNVEIYEQFMKLWSNPNLCVRYLTFNNLPPVHYRVGNHDNEYFQVSNAQILSTLELILNGSCNQSLKHLEFIGIDWTIEELKQIEQIFKTFNTSLKSLYFSPFRYNRNYCLNFVQQLCLIIQTQRKLKTFGIDAYQFRGLTQATLFETLSQLPVLSKLFIRQMELNHEWLPYFTNLRKLILDHCYKEIEDPTRYLFFQNFPALTTLKCNGMDFSLGINLEKQISQLEELKLIDCDLDNQSILYICNALASVKYPRLRHLNLNQNLFDLPEIYPQVKEIFHTNGSLLELKGFYGISMHIFERNANALKLCRYMTLFTIWASKQIGLGRDVGGLIARKVWNTRGAFCWVEAMRRK